VGVYDPLFAQKVRNRAKLGTLENLQASILASGTARPGFEEGGRKGKLVESITNAFSVDWVTRAGAGGRAVRLVENEPEGEDNMGTTPPAEESAEVEEAVEVEEVEV